MKFYILKSDLENALNGEKTSVEIFKIKPDGMDSLGFNSRDCKVKIDPGPGVRAWEAYECGFKSRYGVAPVRNKLINGQLSNFVNRIPHEEIESVIGFFFSHNDYFYVKTMHSVGIMLRDAEKLRAEWKSGQKMSHEIAKSADSKGHYQDQMARIASKESGW